MRATEFVQSYFDAWNQRDPVAVAGHLSADGTYVDVAENSRGSHDELIVNLHEFFTTHRHRYELVGEILVGPRTIAFQYLMLPSTDGSGSDVAIRGAEFMTLSRGFARTIYDYYEIPGGQPPAKGPLHCAKYAKSGLSEVRMAAYKERLDAAMRREQAYLQIDLTLPRLAAIIGCTVNHLSQVINAGYGTSFFDYVNQFRVEHAKQLLADPSDRNGATLHIAYAVGFSSNSTFYTAFKKYVGQTPAQYRRQRNQAAH